MKAWFRKLADYLRADEAERWLRKQSVDLGRYTARVPDLDTAAAVAPIIDADVLAWRRALDAARQRAKEEAESACARASEESRAASAAFWARHEERRRPEPRIRRIG